MAPMVTMEGLEETRRLGKSCGAQVREPSPPPMSVSAVGQQKLFLVDPQGGSLTVKADRSREGRGVGAAVACRGGSGGMERPMDGVGAMA